MNSVLSNFSYSVVWWNNNNKRRERIEKKSIKSGIFQRPYTTFSIFKRCVCVCFLFRLLLKKKLFHSLCRDVFSSDKLIFIPSFFSFFYNHRLQIDFSDSALAFCLLVKWKKLRWEAFRVFAQNKREREKKRRGKHSSFADKVLLWKIIIKINVSTAVWCYVYKVSEW